MKTMLAITCLLLGACQGRPYAIFGLGLPERHTVETKAGAGCVWPSGVQAEITYEPWLFDQSDTSRGRQELGRVFGEVKIPLGACR